MTKVKQIASATCKTGDGVGGIYDVLYPGRHEMDTDVTYGYLQHLVRLGYDVRVAATPMRAAHEVRSAT